MEIGTKVLVKFRLAHLNLTLTNTFFAVCFASFLFIILMIILGKAAKRGKPKSLAYLAEIIYDFLIILSKGH